MSSDHHDPASESVIPGDGGTDHASDEFRAPVRPALVTLLRRDQRALLEPTAVAETHVDAGLRNGFATRREIIEWYQRATVRSFGHIADDFPPTDLVRDRVLIEALLEPEARREYDPDPLSDADAAENRRRLEVEILHPAFNAAYNELRTMAHEYVGYNNGGDGPSPAERDPLRQKNPAMRPGFTQKDREQAQALAALWGGFDSTEALRDWLHGLNAPTNGAIDDDLAAATYDDPVARRNLLGTGVADADARAYREAYAVVKLLPAFVEGIKRMNTAELASKHQDPDPWNENY